MFACTRSQNDVAVQSRTRRPLLRTCFQVFTHYLDGLQNNFGSNSLGKNSTWTECVNEFDAEAYAESAVSVATLTHCLAAATAVRVHACLRIEHIPLELVYLLAAQLACPT